MAAEDLIEVPDWGPSMEGPADYPSLSVKELSKNRKTKRKHRHEDLELARMAAGMVQIDFAATPGEQAGICASVGACWSFPTGRQPTGSWLYLQMLLANLHSQRQLQHSLSRPARLPSSASRAGATSSSRQGRGRHWGQPRADLPQRRQSSQGELPGGKSGRQVCILLK